MSALPKPLTDLALEPSLRRMLSPGLEASLEQFASPEVLGAGKVNLIGLDAVARRFGARWPARMEHVHAHVHALLDRQVGVRGYHLRISETDILICQPELTRLAGQAFCLRVLREILTHFLGAAEPSQLAVHEVLEVTPRGVEARPVDPRASESPDEDAPLGPSLSADTPNSILGSVSVWTPFVASNGCQVDVRCSVDAVQELKAHRTIGLRFRRSVADRLSGREFSRSEIARLSRSDRLRIDLGTVAIGLKTIRDRGWRQPPPALILPVSFSSLSNLEDRARIVSAFHQASPYASRGLICELSEIDGVPVSTLQSAATMIAPSSLFVIGHLEAFTAREARVLKEAGLKGISTEFPSHLPDEAFLPWVKRAVIAGKHAARSVLLYRLPSVQQAMIAAAIGATHAHVET